MLSPKMFLLACVLLAMSLSLALAHITLIEQELNGHAVLKPWIPSQDSNRPMSICGPLPTGSVPRVHRGTGNCPFNFILSLSPESLTQVQASSSLVQLSMTLVSGISVPVALSVHGMPAGTEILFSPVSGRPSFSSIIKIATSAGTPLGQFNITVLASGGGLEKSAFLSLIIVPIVHNIAVISASVQGTATVGSIVLINATVANYGSVPETLELRAFANTTLVANQSVLNMVPTAVYAGRLMWNTTGYSPGTYTILVSVPPIEGELNLVDNSREAGQLLLAQTTGSRPTPSPAASGGNGQGFTYGRQLTIFAAIAEVAFVFLVVLRAKVKGSSRNALAGSRKI